MYLVAVAGGLLLAACSSGKPASQPFAHIQIDNSNANNVLVLSCPPCKPGGAQIPGNAGGNGWMFLGWDVAERSSLSYTMAIHGRRIACRAPKPLPSPLPDQTKYPFHLTYRVTKAGRCVIVSQGYEP